MSHKDKAVEFLWSFLRVGLVDGHLNLALERLAAFQESGEEVPSAMDSILMEIWSSGSKSKIYDLALECMRKFFFDPVRQARLVSILHAHQKIDCAEARDYLDFKGLSQRELPASVGKVADVVWLLDQDRSLGLQKNDCDDLLAKALATLAAEGMV